MCVHWEHVVFLRFAQSLIHTNETDTMSSKEKKKGLIDPDLYTPFKCPPKACRVIPVKQFCTTRLSNEGLVQSGEQKLAFKMAQFQRFVTQ